MQKKTKFSTKVTSHGRQGFHHHWQLYCLFNSRYRNTWIKSAWLRTSDPLWGGTTGDLWNIHYIHIVCSTPHTRKMKENIKIPHYWSLMGRQNWWPMESPHKGPAMRKALINHAIPGLQVLLLFINIMETTLTQEHKVISHHWKLYCWFNIPYWKTLKKQPTNSLWGESIGDQWNLHTEVCVINDCGKTSYIQQGQHVSVLGFHLIGNYIETISMA